MRKSAYIEAIGQASRLPLELPELKGYFRDGYSPRIEAIQHIIKKARKDDSLFDGEFVSVWIEGNVAQGLPRVTLVEEKAKKEKVSK